MPGPKNKHLVLHLPVCRSYGDFFPLTREHAFCGNPPDFIVALESNSALVYCEEADVTRSVQRHEFLGEVPRHDLDKDGILPRRIYPRNGPSPELSSGMLIAWFASKARLPSIELFPTTVTPPAPIFSE